MKPLEAAIYRLLRPHIESTAKEICQEFGIREEDCRKMLKPLYRFGMKAFWLSAGFVAESRQHGRVRLKNTVPVTTEYVEEEEADTDPFIQVPVSLRSSK